MAANDSELTDNETARQVSLGYLIIIGILGVVSNSLVIIVFVKHEKLRTAANLFILNLAICDLIISIMDGAFSIPSTYNQRWVFGRTACVFYGFIHYFFISTTVSTLAAISIDRFFYITKPAQVKTWRITRTRALGMLSVIYIYVLLFTFPPLTGWNSFVTEEYFYSGCYINYSDQDPAAIGYSVVASTFLFLAPLIVMIVCYHKIYKAVRTSTRKTISRGPGPPGTPGTLRKKYPLFKRTHVQTAKMIIVVIFFCVIVWLPYVVVSLIKAFTGNSVVSPLSSHITILITKSCVVYNVLIYVFLNRKLKSSIISLICCGRLPQWLNRVDNTSISKKRISRMVGETDKEIPSDTARNRLSRLFKLGQNNDSANSSELPTPVMQRKQKGLTNHALSGSSPSLLLNGKIKSVDYRDNCPQTSGMNNEALEIVNCETNDESSKKEPNSRSLSQTHSDGPENNILSFSTLEFEKHAISSKEPHPGLVKSGKNDVTRVEARRRALRKMNHKEAGTRKLPEIPKTEPTKSTIMNNNNGKLDQKDISPIVLHSRENSSSTANPSSNNSLSDTSASPTAEMTHGKFRRKNSALKPIILHSRENSTSTAIPSSNHSLSEVSINTSLTSAKDDSSVDVSPRTPSMAYSTPRNLSRKSKTIGYRGGRNVLLRERLRHSSKDPLHVSPSELQEIRTYWKRMSLRLDEINIDEDV